MNRRDFLEAVINCDARVFTRDRDQRGDLEDLLPRILKFRSWLGSSAKIVSTVPKAIRELQRLIRCSDDWP